MREETDKDYGCPVILLFLVGILDRSIIVLTITILKTKNFSETVSEGVEFEWNVDE